MNGNFVFTRTSGCIWTYDFSPDLCSSEVDTMIIEISDVGGDTYVEWYTSPPGGADYPVASRLFSGLQNCDDWVDMELDSYTSGAQCSWNFASAAIEITAI